MKPKIPSNNLVGRRVLIDWPMRWKDCRPEFVEQMKAEAEKSSPHFGKTGEIVAYHQSDESGNSLEVLIDGGRIESFHDGAVTVTSPAPNPMSETELLLRQILAALTKE